MISIFILFYYIVRGGSRKVEGIFLVQGRCQREIGNFIKWNLLSAGKALSHLCKTQPLI